MSQNTIGKAVRILWVFFVIAVIVKSVVGAMHSKEVSGSGVGRGA